MQSQQEKTVVQANIRACLTCRARKTVSSGAFPQVILKRVLVTSSLAKKCDGEQPCVFCVSRGEGCIFEERRKPAASEKALIEKLSKLQSRYDTLVPPACPGEIIARCQCPTSNISDGFASDQAAKEPGLPCHALTSSTVTQREKCDLSGFPNVIVTDELRFQL